MELLVFLVIMFIVFRNIGKQRKGRRSAPFVPPVQGSDDAMSMGGEDANANGNAMSAAPAQPAAQPMQQRSKAARKPFAAKPSTTISKDIIDAADDLTAQSAKELRDALKDMSKAMAKTMRGGASAGRAASEAGADAGGSLSDQPTLLDMDGGSLSGQPTLLDMAGSAPCEDGYGSLAHTRHEGEAFHARGTHSAKRAPIPMDGPGSLAARIAAESALADAIDEVIPGAMPETDARMDGDERPALLGLELDNDTMRRAVVFSEIVNKRGGRHGWVRI